MNDLQRAQAEADAITALLVGHGYDPADAPAALEPQDEALLARILAPRPHRTVRRGWLQVASAACVALLALVGVLGVQSKQSPAVAGVPPTLTFGTAPLTQLFAGTAPSASDELRRLSAVAAAQLPTSAVGSPHVESYAWWWASSTDENGLTVSAFEPVFRSSFVHADGSVTSTEDRSSGLDVNGKVVDRRADAAAGTVATDHFPAGTMDPRWALDLPRHDDAALRTALLDRMGGEEFCTATWPGFDGVPYCLGSVLQELYGWHVVPSGLAAALWRTIADEGGAYLLGPTVDRVGRQGVAIAIMEPPGLEVPRADVYVISPTTGQLLSWELVDEAPGEPAGGTVNGFEAITLSELVRP
jgi:hypothetical protein